MTFWTPSWLKNDTKENTDQYQSIGDINNVISNPDAGNVLNYSPLKKTQPTTTPEAAPEAKKASFGTEDYIGMGLQIAAAIKADREAEEATQKAEESKKEDYQQNYILNQRERADQLQQNVAQQQQQARGLNLNALDYLANQRKEAYGRRLNSSFASNLANVVRNR